ncbi:MAG: PAS domain S-box protein, partial [Sphingomonas sp.]
GIGMGAAEASLKAVFEHAPVGLSLASRDGRSIMINEQMRRLLGRDISQGGIDRYLGANAVHPDGSAYLLEEYPQVDAIVQGVETNAAPFLIERPDGSRRRTEVSSVPLRQADGAVSGAVSVVVDVEERERAIEHQNLLIGELAHRMKNTMAMVQAIVHQSLRSATSLADARENVVSRFEALARAHDLLTKADWRLADLSTVVRGALSTVVEEGRVTIEGHAVDIGARAALSFTLVLHELATNAIKYGALSGPDGRVSVRWRDDPSESGRALLFSWSEQGGPPVSAPTRKGFGARLIDSIGRGFGGRSELRHDPSGVVWLTSARLDRLKSS